MAGVHRVCSILHIITHGRDLHDSRPSPIHQTVAKTSTPEPGAFGFFSKSLSINNSCTLHFIQAPQYGAYAAMGLVLVTDLPSQALTPLRSTLALCYLQQHDNTTVTPGQELRLFRQPALALLCLPRTLDTTAYLTMYGTKGLEWEALWNPALGRETVESAGGFHRRNGNSYRNHNSFPADRT